MAQSRINKAGSIFTRLNGLIKSSLIPWNERPLWYDVYKRFPPARDPSYRSVLGNHAIHPLPPKIFYKEDELRAYYFKNISPIETVVLNSNLVKPNWEIIPFLKLHPERYTRGHSKSKIREGSMCVTHTKKALTHLFIETYYSLKKKGISSENLINSTIEELQNKGYYFVKDKEKKENQSVPQPQNEVGKLLESLNLQKLDSENNLNKTTNASEQNTDLTNKQV